MQRLGQRRTRLEAARWPEGRKGAEMTVQASLFDAWGTVVSVRQPELFEAGSGLALDVRCAQCYEYLVRSEGGYGVCPRGHGKLKPLTTAEGV